VTDYAHVARLAEQPGQTAIVLDVDGTLAPIVARPRDARVPDETRHELARLHRRYALVACVSGRTAADARRVVGVDELVYVGEHGLELDRRAEGWAPTIAAFAESVDWPSERKPLTIAFHYRNEPDENAAVVVLERVAERAVAEGLRPRWGRKVLEIRPPLDTNKGTAVRALLASRQLGRALYAGDDSTDLDAFVGLDGLDYAVRVAIVSTEGPSELGAAADLVLGSPVALLELLRRL
jgi:trehalose 6-phosphate phosphatase